jgi:hypothetical protein
MPNSAQYSRYAEVAQSLAKQERGADHSMWAELALLWQEVAEYTAAEEAQLPAPHRSHFRLRRRDLVRFLRATGEDRSFGGNNMGRSIRRQLKRCPYKS